MGSGASDGTVCCYMVLMTVDWAAGKPVCKLCLGCVVAGKSRGKFVPGGLGIVEALG